MQKWFWILLLTPVIGLVSCEKENTPRLAKLGLTDTSETKPYLDTTNFGIFKGVLTGTSGTIKITFNNGNNVMKAFIQLDSFQEELTCTQPYAVSELVVAALFEGSCSSFTFTVDANGENASIDNIFVAGRINVFGVIAHEKSNQVVHCYESKFTGSQQGRFNFIRYGNRAQGIARNNAGDTYVGKGLITGDIFKVNLYNSATQVRIFQGGIEGTGDYFSGSWLEEDGSLSGVFNGVRTL